MWLDDQAPRLTEGGSERAHTVHPVHATYYTCWRLLKGAAALPFVHISIILHGSLKTYFRVSMEHPPADARAAPSASEPNDTVMDIHESPKRPREASQGNLVSQRATSPASVLPESQTVTTDLLPRAPARACQSLAHHTTPMGRCRKTVDTWAPLSEEPQSRSTTTLPAERLGKHSNSAILAAVHHCGHTQTTPGRESTRVPNIPCPKE
eukprot:scaffold9263_cov132-Isochrysis_galbana.AAC.1